MDLIRYMRTQWDRVGGAACMIGGALAVGAGWVGVSRALTPAAQLPYVISGGIGGLFLLGVGATLWLSADLRDEWRHLDALEDRVVARVTESLTGAVDGSPAASPTSAPPSNGNGDARPLVATGREPS